MAQTFLTMLREVREYEQKQLGIMPEAHDPTTEAEVKALIDSVQSESGLRTLMESVLPKSDGKQCDDLPVPDDIHARFVAALSGEPLLEAKPLPKAKDLTEQQKEIELPDGIHYKLCR